MQNIDKKENMIMRYGKFATIMQNQEEDKAQKSIEREQWAMSSTPTGKYLLLIYSVLSVGFINILMQIIPSDDEFV